MTKCTEGDWSRGMGKGVTGPTTPAVGGATVAMEVQYNLWEKGGYKAEDYPFNDKFYDLVVAPGDFNANRVIAICPHPNGTENAQMISASKDMYKALDGMICGGCNNRIGWNGEHCGSDWRTCTHCQAPRAALAKARGERAV